MVARHAPETGAGMDRNPQTNNLSDQKQHLGGQEAQTAPFHSTSFLFALPVWLDRVWKELS
jgi:hypothetical protein